MIVLEETNSEIFVSANFPMQNEIDDERKRIGRQFLESQQKMYQEEEEKKEAERRKKTRSAVMGFLQASSEDHCVSYMNFVFTQNKMYLYMMDVFQKSTGDNVSGVQGELK